MNVFWPAIGMGILFLSLGSLILAFRHRVLRLVHKRYSNAQERHPEIEPPGQLVPVLLGSVIIVFGVMAIGLAFIS